MRADRASTRLSSIPDRFAALGTTHKAGTARPKVLAIKREAFSSGWYRRYRWYSKEKCSDEVVLTRVPGGTGISLAGCWYPPVPLTGTPLKCSIPFEYHLYR